MTTAELEQYYREIYAKTMVAFDLRIHAVAALCAAVVPTVMWSLRGMLGNERISNGESLETLAGGKILRP